jgi:rSAM/selenodomain-associated transferase 1
MVDLANADVVAVLTRAPGHGGKSRLFGALGISPDEALLSALLLDTIDGVAGAGVRTVVAVTPSAAVDAMAAAVAPLSVIPQPGGSLGDRMRHTMQALFDAGARRVALVGSDLPTITGDRIVQAFTALDRAPGALVLGPAADGGYYLIAAAQVPPVFDEIEWGSLSVLAETRARALRAGLAVHEIAALRDVDTPADLREVISIAPQSRTAAWALRHCD